MKHSFEFLMWLLKPFKIDREIESKSSQNFMLIRSGLQTTVAVFSLYELLMSLRIEIRNEDVVHRKTRGDNSVAFQ